MLNFEPTIISQDEFLLDLENHIKQAHEFKPLYKLPAANIGVEYMIGTFGWNLWTKCLYEYPRKFKQILDASAESNYNRAKVFCENSEIPIFMVCDDMAGNHGPFISPRLMRKYYFPWLRRFTKMAHRNDTFFIFHSDGDLMPLMDDLVGSGIDGLNPIEPYAGMNLARIKEMHGDHLVLLGNVCCSSTLITGSTEAVVKESKRCLRDGAPGGGYFFGSSSEIHDACPVSNCEAMYATLRRYGAYPL